MWPCCEKIKKIFWYFCCFQIHLKLYSLRTLTCTACNIFGPFSNSHWQKQNIPVYFWSLFFHESEWKLINSTLAVYFNQKCDSFRNHLFSHKIGREEFYLKFYFFFHLKCKSDGIRKTFNLWNFFEFLRRYLIKCSCY